MELHTFDDEKRRKWRERREERDLRGPDIESVPKKMVQVWGGCTCGPTNGSNQRATTKTEMRVGAGRGRGGEGGLFCLLCVIMPRFKR